MKVPMRDITEAAKALIEADGWNVVEGPFLNSVLAESGIYAVSIKSVLSKADLERREIKWDKGCLPGSQRTVRFLCNVTLDGEVTAVNHITSSQRKRLGKMMKTPRRRARRKQSA
jgi:hypothetical protein